MQRTGSPEILAEHQDSVAPIQLDLEERDALQQLIPGLALRPLPSETNLYIANPGGSVGAVQLGDRRFELRPKIPISRLAFILAYSMDPSHWRDSGFDFEEDADIFEAIIPGFCYQIEEALRRGLLQGYRTEETALQTLRGRIRFDDQLRSRFGLLPPIECRFDEFTEDIEINRLLKAAIERAGQIRLRDNVTRRRLRALRAAFTSVTAVRYDPRAVPEVLYTRLNMAFKPATEFARLILRSRSLEFRSGEVSGAAFLLSMDAVFEDFVVRALREELGLSRRAFPQGAIGRELHLDMDSFLRLRPDFSWWEGDQCVFVGDVKYKKAPDIAGVKHADVYQVLAYVTATDLSNGMIIYAHGEAPERRYLVRHSGQDIDVRTIDLDVDPEAVLDQIGELADAVRKGRRTLIQSSLAAV